MTDREKKLEQCLIWLVREEAIRFGFDELGEQFRITHTPWGKVVTPTGYVHLLQELFPPPSKEQT